MISRFKSAQISRRCTPGTVLACLLTATFLSPTAEALGRFGGGGAHFNIGGHFNGMRPMGGAGFGMRPDFRPGRVYPAGHPFAGRVAPADRHFHPRYWPYPGRRYWAGAAAGAAVGAAAAGAWLYTLPADCSSISIGGITYEQCGPEWYRPMFTGAHIAYEPVAAPR